MKILQKLILPLLLLLVVFIIYKFYFAKSGLGSFDDFDPNNNAVKEEFRFYLTRISAQKVEVFPLLLQIKMVKRFRLLDLQVYHKGLEKQRLLF
jgi:hypothetical protein